MTVASDAKAARKVTLAAALLAGAITIATAIGTLVVSIQNHASTKALAQGQEEIHVMVNNRLSEALAKIGRLELRLAEQSKDEGAIVEAKKSIEDAERSLLPEKPK